MRDCCCLSLYVATSFYLSDDSVCHRADAQKYLLHKPRQFSFPFSPSVHFLFHLLHFLHFLKFFSFFQTESQWPFPLECKITSNTKYETLKTVIGVWIWRKGPGKYIIWGEKKASLTDHISMVCPWLWCEEGEDWCNTHSSDFVPCLLELSSLCTCRHSHPAEYLPVY